MHVQEMSEAIWIFHWQVDGFYRDSNVEVLECEETIYGSE